MRLHVLAIAALVAVPALATAPAKRHPEGASPITLGQTYRVQSGPLGEQRRINVVLPPGYTTDPKRLYPVLYLIDGGMEQDLLHVSGVAQLGAIWGRSQPMIVVGIETKDRRRELTGPTTDPDLLKRHPTAGSSASFRAFVRDEVKSLVERRYRTSGEDAVLGESLAGLFVIETYLAEPALFDHYAAVDPSLWWDREALSLSAAARLSAAQASKSLYIAIAAEQAAEPAAANRLLGALRSRGLKVCEQWRTGLTHPTIYQQVTPVALQEMLPPTSAPPPEYGFKVECAPPPR